jgi:hypothetical protein
MAGPRGEGFESPQCPKSFLKMTKLVLGLFVCLVAFTGTVNAQYPGDWLCDNSYQDCRTPIINAIRNEPVTGGIDVSFWFMTDWRFAGELVKAHNRGVPIRVIMDLTADSYNGKELAHEYVWTEYQSALQRGDHHAIQVLELRCDGIAVLTLRHFGLSADRLIKAAEMLTWYNQERKLDGNWRNYAPHRVFTARVLTTLLASPSSAQSVDERTIRTAAAAGAKPLDARKAQSIDAHSDTVIDCGPITRLRGENCVRTIRRALALLPRRPETIQVLDPDRATPDLRASLQHVDGLTIPGRRVVYLNRRGEVLEGALKRAGVWECVLATVVWHEMAHIDGAQEPEAQRREEQLWLQFILWGKVDGGRGLAYLSLLRKRRD